MRSCQSLAALAKLVEWLGTGIPFIWGLRDERLVAELHLLLD
jgi:hypothetical protein